MKVFCYFKGDGKIILFALKGNVVQVNLLKFYLLTYHVFFVVPFPI